MTAFSLRAPWRIWLSVSKTVETAGNTYAAGTGLPRHLSDHLARDIGVSPAELDRLRHQWPSETHRHPQL